MNVPVQNGQLPQGFCPPDYQTMLNAFSAQQFVSVDTIAGTVVSATPPADHTTSWLQLDSFGRPVRTYYFAQGAWLSLHPLPPGFTMLWNQVLPNFTIFDGGDANAAPWSALSGQMWQLMAATLDGLSVAPLNDVMNAKFPVGVGTFLKPDGTVSSGPIAVGANTTGNGVTGEDVHILSKPELPAHDHIPDPTSDKPHKILLVAPYAGSITGSDTVNSGSEQAVGPNDGAAIANVGQGLGHNNLPPMTGVYFLQRTNRLFYVVPP
jgi:hypothetical protein